MPNEYSIQIHNYISEQIANQKQIIDDPHIPQRDREYAKGWLEELSWFRTYLADNIDLKDFTYY